MIILQSVQSILSIIIMISIGYILSGRGWFNEDSKKLLSKLVTNISLPAFMVENLIATFDKKRLYEISGGLIIPFLSMLIGYIIAIFVSKAIKIDEKRKGTFETMFFVSNTIFVGLPVNLALFGNESIPYVLLYYIANTTFFWTIGVYSISKDGDAKGISLFSLSALKKIFSPPLLGFIVGIILIILEIPLPKFLLDTGKYVGNLTTPLSMIFIGTTIYSVGFKDVKFSKDTVALSLGRFLIAPVIVIILSHYIGGPLLMKEVFIIQASMPVMTQTSIIAKAYNSDYEYAAVMTVVTTILAIVSIPLYMFFIDKIQFFL